MERKKEKSKGNTKKIERGNLTEGKAQFPAESAEPMKRKNESSVLVPQSSEYSIIAINSI